MLHTWTSNFAKSFASEVDGQDDQENQNAAAQRQQPSRHGKDEHPGLHELPHRAHGRSRATLVGSTPFGIPKGALPTRHDFFS
jgi:hypothetical protein